MGGCSCHFKGHFTRPVSILENYVHNSWLSRTLNGILKMQLPTKNISLYKNDLIYP